MALEAYDELRSAELAEWLRLIEQEHNNIRAALEWAFSAGAPSERVDQGFCLINSIGRFWEARGHIQEGITWLERGLQVNQTASMPRARALRMAGLLYNHGEDEQTPVR